MQDGLFYLAEGGPSPSPTFGPLAQDTYEPNDPEAIQKSFARHLEYSLACTRFNFTMQDGFIYGIWTRSPGGLRDRTGRTVGRWPRKRVQDAYRAAGLVLRDRLLAPWKTKQRYGMNKHFPSLVFSWVLLTKVPQFQILCLLEILCEFFWRLCTLLVDFKVMTNVKKYSYRTCIISGRNMVTNELNTSENGESYRHSLLCWHTTTCYAKRLDPVVRFPLRSRDFNLNDAGISMEKLKDLKSQLNAFSCEENLWPL